RREHAIEHVLHLHPNGSAGFVPPRDLVAIRPPGFGHRRLLRAFGDQGAAFCALPAHCRRAIADRRFGFLPASLGLVTWSGEPGTDSRRLVEGRRRARPWPRPSAAQPWSRTRALSDDEACPGSGAEAPARSGQGPPPRHGVSRADGPSPHRTPPARTL